MVPKPIVQWLGGKRRLAKHILPKLNPHHTYVEPFCGGAAIFFCKAPSAVEVLNDINGELVNLYRVVQTHLDEFLRTLEFTLVSRAEFDRHQAQPPETLTDIQRAARFYYLQRTAFGGLVEGQTFGTAKTCPPKLNLTTVESDLQVAHNRLCRVYIENLPWTECVARYDGADTLFYLDPPYYGTKGYGVEFPIEQYEFMAELATSIKGQMIISVNDTPEMRHCFQSLTVDTLSTEYTVAKGAAKAVTELLLTNEQHANCSYSLF